MQRPIRRPDGRLYPGGGPRSFSPPDPAALLPPDSAALLPTMAGTTAMVGVCNCGEPDCGSLWMRVRRTGDVVVWQPDPDPPDASIDRTWTFDLRRYLDAIDIGQGLFAPLESRARVIARELRRRDDLWAGSTEGGSKLKPLHLLDARAGIGPTEIVLEVAFDHGIRRVEVEAQPGMTDQQVVERLRVVTLADTSE